MEIYQGIYFQGGMYRWIQGKAQTLDTRVAIIQRSGGKITPQGIIVYKSKLNIIIRLSDKKLFLKRMMERVLNRQKHPQMWHKSIQSHKVDNMSQVQGGMLGEISVFT